MVAKPRRWGTVKRGRRSDERAAAREARGTTRRLGVNLRSQAGVQDREAADGHEPQEAAGSHAPREAAASHGPPEAAGSHTPRKDRSRSRLRASRNPEPHRPSVARWSLHAACERASCSALARAGPRKRRAKRLASLSLDSARSSYADRGSTPYDDHWAFADVERRSSGRIAHPAPRAPRTPSVAPRQPARRRRRGRNELPLPASTVEGSAEEEPARARHRSLGSQADRIVEERTTAWELADLEQAQRRYALERWNAANRLGRSVRDPFQ